MEPTKLSVKAFGIAFSILWGFAVLMVGICNFVWMGYGENFLALVSSIYPFYQLDGTLGSVVIGTAWALLDGFIGGMILAWLYNCALKCKCTKTEA